MKKINIIYWNSDNYGDILNPVLIEELSGLPTQYKDITLSKKDRIYILLKDLIRLNFKRIKTIILPWENTMTAIGSILSWAKKDSVIWGSGFMNGPESFAGGETLAVRGKLTDMKLKKDGFPGCPVYGDPALLLPLWIKPAKEKKYKLGLIPHWSEVDFFIRHYSSRYHIIDLRTRDIFRVTREIAACEYVLSTSLHGLIVAQAYDVPALWIKKGYIDTDGFKFHDYFSSVGIPLYDGIENIDEILDSEANWKQLIQDNSDKLLINNSLEEIQSNLLKVAPFPLKEKYKKCIQ